MNVFTGQLEGVPGGRVGHSYLSAHSVQLATAPLSAAQLERVLPRRHSCGDTGHLRLRYFRLDREGRFVIGGPGWLTPPRTAGAMSFRILEASARRMFPALGDTPFEHRWTARDTITPDAVPHLYEPSPGLFAALGYNGRGLAIGTALGNVLARRVLGEPAGAMPFRSACAPPRSSTCGWLSAADVGEHRRSRPAYFTDGGFTSTMVAMPPPMASPAPLTVPRRLMVTPLSFV